MNKHYYVVYKYYLNWSAKEKNTIEVPIVLPENYIKAIKFPSHEKALRFIQKIIKIYEHSHVNDFIKKKLPYYAGIFKVTNEEANSTTWPSPLEEYVFSMNLVNIIKDIQPEDYSLFLPLRICFLS